MRLEPYGFLTNPFHSAEIIGEWYRYFLTPTMRGFSFKAKAKSVLPVRRVPSRINFGQSFVTIGLMIRSERITNFGLALCFLRAKLYGPSGLAFNTFLGDV